MTIDLSNHTILIVEDDELSYKYLELLFTKKTNIHLKRAKNGLEAVNSVKGNPEIDIVLMDIQLPVMNGFEAIKEIRKFSELPIIVQTANDIRHFDDNFDGISINEILRKPMDINDVLNAVVNNIKFLPINN